MSEIGESKFRENPDISSVFIRQLDRTNQAATVHQTIYEASVQQSLAVLPTKWRLWVYANSDRYETTELTLLYRKNSGVRMGTPNNPILYDERIPVQRYPDKSIDWTDENILSPVLREVTTVDYHKMFEVIMDAAQFAGLTWQIDPIEQDAGDTEEYIVERRATPYTPQLNGIYDEPEI